MENIVEQGLLYDFYGELLTQHQRQVYEAAVYDDLSLSEIAAEFGITRQGVHDLLRRCDKTLQGYEEKLHLLEKFRQTKSDADAILKEAGRFRCDADLRHITCIEERALKIKEAL